MTPPLYGCTAKNGLQVLKDKWGQKRYFGEQSQYLADHLSIAIDATKKKVPKRVAGFQLDRSETESISKYQRERIWERSVFLRWNEPNINPVGNCWNRVIAFQTPLFSDESKDSWGYIDLLGFVDNGIPSVIELKKDPSTRKTGGTNNSESPLRIVLEAAAYAVALRENWCNFRNEYIERLKKLKVSDEVIDGVPTSLEKVQLVGAAPASYWLDWLPVTAKGITIKLKTWNSFNNLLNALADEGMPTSFVSLSGDSDCPEKLAAQPLEQFPLLN